MGRKILDRETPKILPFLLAGLLALWPLPTLSREAPKVVKIGLDSYPTRFDPRFATDASSYRVVQLVFSGLVKKDPSSNLIPDLAASWEMPSPVEYLFHLREKVRFHDGRPLTADDVAFTFRSILDEATGSPKRGSFTQIKTIEVVDPLTVRFVLEEPFSPFLINMTQGIVPARLAGDLKEFSAHPVGTGPFRFEKAVTDQEVVLEAFNDYHGGRPPLDEIRLVAVPEETVRVLALIKGDLDFVQNGVSGETLPKFERDDRFQVIKRPGSNYSYIGLNLEDPILKNPRVRQALAMAIDRQAIIEHLLSGLAVSATGVLPPTNWAYEPKVTVYPHDPAAAARLLDEAGYPDPDGDGPEIRFSILYKTSQNELGKRIGEVLQAQWAKIGVGVTIRSYEWGTFYADVKDGNFQVYRLEWVGITEPDIYYYIFHSSMIPPEGANRGRYRDPEVDRLIEEGRKTMDQDQRREIYSRIQKIAGRDLPYISLWYPTNVIIMRREIENFVPYPAGDFTSFSGVDWIPAH